VDCCSPPAVPKGCDVLVVLLEGPTLKGRGPIPVGWLGLLPLPERSFDTRRYWDIHAEPYELGKTLTRLLEVPARASVVVAVTKGVFFKIAHGPRLGFVGVQPWITADRGVGRPYRTVRGTWDPHLGDDARKAL
jgi:hypothetical protein